MSGTLVYRTRPGDEVRFGRAEGAMALPEPSGPGPAAGRRGHRRGAAQGAADRAGRHRRPAVGGAVLGRTRPRRALRHRRDRRDRPGLPAGPRWSRWSPRATPGRTRRAWSPTRSRRTANGRTRGVPGRAAADAGRDQRRPADCSAWRRNASTTTLPEGSGRSSRARRPGPCVRGRHERRPARRQHVVAGRRDPRRAGHRGPQRGQHRRVRHCSCSPIRVSATSDSSTSPTHSNGLCASMPSSSR